MLSSKVQLTAALALSAALPAVGSTLRVPQDFPTIQEAVDAALLDDVVSVAPGTYPGPILIDGKNHLTIQCADPVGGKVVIDAKETPYGIVARNLDGLILQWLTVEGYPSEVNRAGILLDGAGIAGGGPAPLSRIVIRFTNVTSPGNGIEINGGTVHVVAHCDDIQVGGDYAVGWGSNDLIRVKFSTLHALPDTTPRAAIFAAGTCEPYSDGTVTYHNRIYRNRIEGPFLEGMRFQDAQDLVVGNNVVRLETMGRDGADSAGVVFGPGCVGGLVSSDVSFVSNDVAGARFGLVLAAIDGVRVLDNKLNGNGGRSHSANSEEEYGSAIRIGLPSGTSAPACRLNIRLNNLMNLGTPRKEPAIWADHGACGPENVMDRTNFTDPGRKLVGP